MSPDEYVESGTWPGSPTLSALTKTYEQGANHRHERKFLITDLSPHETEALVRLHPHMFREVFWPRQVNSLYLDTLNLDNYWDNVCGGSHRLKARLRWYGDGITTVRQPRLEVKAKAGLLGNKWAFVPQSVPTNLDAMLHWVRQGWRAAALPDGVYDLVRSLSPALVNCYQRKYFLSADSAVRLTIDTRLEYYAVYGDRCSMVDRKRDHHVTVLELKYAPEEDERVDQVATRFPFRATRSSKYVMGIDKLRG